MQITEDAPGSLPHPGRPALARLLEPGPRPRALRRRAADGGPGTVHVPKGFYLLLGDNRRVSEDSRTWALEPRGGMIGIVPAAYWPLSGARLFGS
jgi:signal peptidase S26 family